MSKTITDHRHLFRALDAPGPEGRPAGRARTMSTTAHQGDSPNPMLPAGTGGSKATNTAAVAEAGSEAHHADITMVQANPQRPRFRWP